jgi:ribokinase
VAGVAEDPDHASGIAIILLDFDRQNHIVAIYGANAACGEAQLDAAKKALVGADALLLQNEIPIPISMAAARHARNMGVRVVWDPAPVSDLSPDAFDVIDVMTPNETEATALTGVHVADPDSARTAAEILLSRGVRLVLVKLGGQGVCYASDGESGHVPAFAVDVVDTVAAGDAFGAALTLALCEGRSLRDAVHYGTAAGALAVTRPGAQEAMPGRHEVEALLARL